MLVALDIETECAVDGCPKDADCRKKYKHALDFNRNRITLIGVYTEGGTMYSHCSTNDFKKFVDAFPGATYLAHNGKFDFKILKAKGIDLTDKWAHDSELLASVITKKIPDQWLEQYEQQRAEKNKELPSGYEHRKAGKHSLKTLAPYHLNVEPFWEDPTDHNNVEYNLKDCQYTFELYKKLRSLATEEELDFYENKLLPWTKMLLESELKGIRIDLERLGEHFAESLLEGKELLVALKDKWAAGTKAWKLTQTQELCAKYLSMGAKALEKTGNDISKSESIYARYLKLYEGALEKLEDFNIDSNAQLMWLLKDHLGYDMRNFDGKESTGKEVLERLAGEGKEDVKLLLRYRKLNKLCTSFFPSYNAMVFNGRIHCSFNPTGTRTGRLSSSMPNLQQVPGHLHDIFIADEGYTLITKDFSAIEPRVIAYLSECPVLCELLANGDDFHGLTTKVFFNIVDEIHEIKPNYPTERKVGKETGLSVLYGAGGRRVKRSAQKHGFNWSEESCRQKVLQLKHTYKAVWDYKQGLDQQLKMRRAIPNILGRPIAVENIDDVHMKGFNKLIQSSASDLLLSSAYKFYQHCKQFSVNALPLLYVHDELVVQVPKVISEQMEHFLIQKMTDYDLTTRYGNVSIEVEGSVNERWTK